MPLYTLHCDQCNDTFERFAWGDLAAHDRTCPNCNSEDVAVGWIVEEPYESVASWGCG